MKLLIALFDANDSSDDNARDKGPPVVCSSDTDLETRLQQVAMYIGFDSDSYPILMDLWANCYITPNQEDFISYTPLNPEDPDNASIKDVQGNTTPKGKGTVRIQIMDDDGKSHMFIIENNYHLPTSGGREIQFSTTY
jgi:hypothetical protein